MSAPKPKQSTSKALMAAISASTVLMAVCCAQWDIVELLTPFLMAPLWAIVWLAFLVAFTLALAECVLHLRAWRVSARPLLICLCTAATVLFAPLTELWLLRNFLGKLDDRARIVRLIAHGELRPNAEHNPNLIRLSAKEVLVSKGGNEVVAEFTGNGPYVLFFTYRGVLDNYSGFLHVPPGGDPFDFGDLSDPGQVQVEHIVGSWYFVSHR